MDSVIKFQSLRPRVQIAGVINDNRRGKLVFFGGVNHDGTAFIRSGSFTMLSICLQIYLLMGMLLTKQKTPFGSRPLTPKDNVKCRKQLHISTDRLACRIMTAVYLSPTLAAEKLSTVGCLSPAWLFIKGAWSAFLENTGLSKRAKFSSLKDEELINRVTPHLSKALQLQRLLTALLLAFRCLDASNWSCGKSQLPMVARGLGCPVKYQKHRLS